jgi:hypothetical protein
MSDQKACAAEEIHAEAKDGANFAREGGRTLSSRAGPIHPVLLIQRIERPEDH